MLRTRWIGACDGPSPGQRSGPGYSLVRPGGVEGGSRAAYCQYKGSGRQGGKEAPRSPFTSSTWWLKGTCSSKLLSHLPLDSPLQSLIQVICIQGSLSGHTKASLASKKSRGLLVKYMVLRAEQSTNVSLCSPHTAHRTHRLNSGCEEDKKTKTKKKMRKRRGRRRNRRRGLLADERHRGCQAAAARLVSASQI